MKVFNIPKKSGGKRTIYAPSRGEKARMRLEAYKLNKRVKQECNMDVVHGFVLGHSPVTNAMKHKGYKFTLSMDLKDFFDSVHPYMINNLDGILYHVLFIKGDAKQGLPSSPALSNLACINMDMHINEYCECYNIIYTRYADDLSFSSNDVTQLIRLRDVILPAIIKANEFQVNTKKTRIQYAKYGRRNITGVMVDDDVHPSREIKRRLRASIHQKKKHQIRGLQEWCKLKLPNKQTKRFSKVDKVFVRNIGRKFAGIKNAWD